MSQILAHLRIGDAERFAQLAAGHLEDALSEEALQAAQIEAEPADTGARRSAVVSSRCVSRPVVGIFLFAHVAPLPAVAGWEGAPAASIAV